MNLEEYISLLESPENINATYIEDLKAMLQYAPYCSNTHLLLLKALYESNNINYETELPKTLLYAPDSRSLYFLIYGKRSKRIRKTQQSSGDYFDMMAAIEKKGINTSESLQELAAKLKQARIQLQEDKQKKIFDKPKQLPKEDMQAMEISEEQAKKCIKDKQYKEAIEILQKLSLINPKKKSIFADQIRFLEKVI